MKVKVYMEWKNLIKTGGVVTAYHNRIKACRYAGIEIVEKDFDILQIEFPGIGSYLLSKKAMRKGKKVIFATHITAEDFRDTFAFGRKLFPYLKRYLKKVYSTSSALISPSEYTRRIIRGYGIDRKIYVLSNGIDPDFLSGARKKKKSEKFTIGCVGFVTKRKGVVTFANLARKFPDCIFRWVGDVRKKILFDIGDLEKIPNLHFTGYVEDIRKEYQNFDVFLFPSYEENQGIVLLEAGAYGLPLIVRDIPTYEGWLIHGENCLKCSTERDFEEAVRIILEDEDLRRKLGRNSRKLAERNSLKIIGRELKKIYEEVLNSSM